MELYNNIANVLSKKGINLKVGSIYDFQEIWKSWYRGNVNDFHFYNARINGKNVKCERKTMNMPKKVCEYIAKLLWTEKTRIELSNKIFALDNDVDGEGANEEHHDLLDWELSIYKVLEEGYKQAMENVFGKDSVTKLSIRNCGVLCIE